MESSLAVCTVLIGVGYTLIYLHRILIQLQFVAIII